MGIWYRWADIGIIDEKKQGRDINYIFINFIDVVLDKKYLLKVRVERVVTSPLPHRSGRANFQHPVPQKSALLQRYKRVPDIRCQQRNPFVNIIGINVLVELNLAPPTI